MGDDEVASETGLVFASLEVGDEDRVASLRQTVSQTGIWLNENVARHGKAVDREGSSGGKAPGKRRMTEAELLQEDQEWVCFISFRRSLRLTSACVLRSSNE